MARKRSELSEPVQAPRAAVTVPDVFKIGACSEVWSDTAHRHDLGSAWGNRNSAREAWAKAEGLTRDEVYALVPGGSPYAHDDRPDILARCGFTEADIPALRRAAQARIRNTESSRRSTP